MKADPVLNHCRRQLHILGAALAAGIFAVDTCSRLHFAVASLYVLVVLLVARNLGQVGIVLTGLSCAALTVVSYLMTHGFTLAGAAPLRSVVSAVSIVITVILMVRNAIATGRLEAVHRERINLARFFSPAIVDRLIEIDTPLSVARLERGAILFADIVGFASQTYGQPAEEVVQLLRGVLRLLGEAVFASHGTIDKFLGDGLMAVFGPPLTSPHDATNAAACAFDICERIDLWNAQQADSPEDIVRVAIGIHFGEVIQGDIGTHQRLEFTVIGDTVNIASRVEAYCRVIDASVLVTGDFMNALLAEKSFHLAEAFTYEGEHCLKGCTEKIKLFSAKKRWVSSDDSLDARRGG
jgi:class 3 adenylate cyclase